MRIRHLLGLGTLLAAAASVWGQPSDPVCALPYACIGNTCYITGNVPTGTYTFSNKNVVIYDATLYECNGDRTFTLMVINGSINVGLSQISFGINGRGTDGTDGVSGGAGGVPPTAGGSPGQPFNVVLMTSPGAGTLTPSIGVSKPIDCSGGNGGDGGDGYGENWDTEKCIRYNAQSGAEATAGSNGGSITIIGSGDITVSDTVTVAGGAGGAGGDGGAGATAGAGTARIGRAGGNGGTISISHTDDVDVPIGFFIGGYVHDDRCYHGLVTAAGGRGGDGGRGGNGNPPTAGAAAGNGGNAGTVAVDVHAMTIDGPNIIVQWVVYCVQPGVISTVGGDGGFGGYGGQAAPGYYQIPPITAECYDGCIGPGAGAVAGAGGTGGNGGAITAVSSDFVSLSDRAIIISDGGLGGFAGVAGDGSADMCGPPGCPGALWCPVVTSGGVSTTSAAGGAAGEIQITAATQLSVAQFGFVSARGGTGAAGPIGAGPGAGCCCACENGVRNCAIDMVVYGASQVGGAGGAGGAGNKIRLWFGTRTGFANFYICGGTGGAGGKGGRGNPPALGGWSGATGGGGQLFYNNVQQAVLCGIQIPQRGPTGDLFTITCMVP